MEHGADINTRSKVSKRAWKQAEHHQEPDHGAGAGAGAGATSLPVSVSVCAVCVTAPRRLCLRVQWGLTPLHRLAEQGAMPVAWLMMLRGADPSLRTPVSSQRAILNSPVHAALPRVLSATQASCSPIAGWQDCCPSRSRQGIPTPRSDASQPRTPASVRCGGRMGPPWRMCALVTLPTPSHD
jgi:hypothetical protein